MSLYSITSADTDSLQILHTDGNHWIALSIFNCDAAVITVNDSKYTTVRESTQNILANLNYTDRPFFSINIPSVSKQSGSSDCGLFAIAYYITHTHCICARFISLCF